MKYLSFAAIIALFLACASTKTTTVKTTTVDTTTVEVVIKNLFEKKIGTLDIDEWQSNPDQPITIEIEDPEPVAIKQPKKFRKSFKVTTTSKDEVGRKREHTDFFTLKVDSGKQTLTRDSSISKSRDLVIDRKTLKEQTTVEKVGFFTSLKTYIILLLMLVIAGIIWAIVRK